MKLMIASDIHGSAYYCRKLLEAYDREKAGRMVILGEISFIMDRAMTFRRNMHQRK